MDTMCMGDSLSVHRGAWRLYTTFLLGLLASGHPQNPVSPRANCHLSGLPPGSHGATHAGSGWTLPCATVQVPRLALTVLVMSPGGPATSQHPAGVGSVVRGVHPWPGCWVGNGVLGTSTGGSRSRSPEGLTGVGDTQPGPARLSLFLNDASVRAGKASRGESRVLPGDAARLRGRAAPGASSRPLAGVPGAALRFPGARGGGSKSPARAARGTGGLPGPGPGPLRGAPGTPLPPLRAPSGHRSRF